MKKKLAFTLSETMLVVAVLGIIATLTIPALVNKNKESVAKTKVRKAMAAYESALNKMIIENDLKSDDTLTVWAGATANCGNPSNYFKKVQGDGCIFKTSDGIWWDISDIERPVISFKEIDNDNATQITTNANNANDKTAFVLVGRFGTDGSLRVDDLAYETANSVKDSNNYESKAQVEKLYKLLGLKSSGAGGSDQSPFAVCFAENAETCIVGGIEYRLMTLTNENETYCTYDDETGEENCSNPSISVEGQYYVSIVGYPVDYNIQAGSPPDYYHAAERYCAAAKGRLATIAELKSLTNQRQLFVDANDDDPPYYWAFEEPYYSTYMYGDFIFDHEDLGIYAEVLCIGQ